MRAGDGEFPLAWRVVARHSRRSLAGSNLGAASTIRALPYSGPAVVSRITTCAPHRQRAQGAGWLRCAPVVVDRVPFMAAVRLQAEPGRRRRSMPHRLDFGTAMRPFGRLLPHYRNFRRSNKAGIAGGDSHQPRSAPAPASCDTVHCGTDRSGSFHTYTYGISPSHRACATAGSSPNESLASCAKV